jgi:glycerophosphoryl diester phosphodiesterase
MKKRILMFLGVIFIFISNFAGTYKSMQSGQKGYQWVPNNRFVAHALGGIDGKPYTNSLEALEASYKKGHRVFEVDLILTSDNKLVARHDWREMFEQSSGRTGEEKGKPMSLNKFKSMKIYRKYTPLDFHGICIFMKEHTDVYLSTDTKETTKKGVDEGFKVLVETAKKVDYSILDRIAPQIYNQEMLPWIKEHYDFKDIIYALYMSPDTDEQVVDFVAKNNIKVVLMHLGRQNKEFVRKLKEEGAYTYVHTVNLLSVVEKLINEEGVQGVYTDFLLPSDIEYINLRQ